MGTSSFSRLKLYCNWVKFAHPGIFFLIKEYLLANIPGLSKTEAHVEGLILTRFLSEHGIISNTGLSCERFKSIAQGDYEHARYFMILYMKWRMCVNGFWPNTIEQECSEMAAKAGELYERSR